MAGNRWKPRDSVVYTPLSDGEGVLLCLEQREFFDLNETGRLIWERLCEGLDTAEITTTLVQEYEVTPEEAARTVESFLAKLVEDRLVESAV